MAKLVEVLARELKVWPEDCVSVTQDESGNVYGWVMDGAEFRGFSWYSPENKDCGMTDIELEDLELASDYRTAIVTRAMWQSERDRRKGGEWKRHRGKTDKSPVGNTDLVEVRFRDGATEIDKGYPRWCHTGDRRDIMAYRVLEKPEQEENVVELKGEAVTLEYQICGEGEEPNPDAWQEIGGNPQSIGTITYTVDLNTEPAMQKIEELQAKWDQLDGPLKWRDGVTELEAYIEEFTRERNELIERLAGEGFALIPPVAGVVSEFTGVDMQDWRNWKVGDVVEVVSANEEGVDIGRRGSVISIENAEYDGRAPVHVNFDGDDLWLFSFSGNGQCVLKFISRP